MVDLGIFRVFRVSIIATYEYFAHYTHNFFLCGERVEGSAWILHIKNETAIGAGQAVQREPIVQDQEVVWHVLSMVGVGCGEGLT